MAQPVQEMQQEVSLQPEVPSTILRPCPECRNPMLLMSVVFQNAGFVTKRYECYACKHLETLTAQPVKE